MRHTLDYIQDKKTNFKTCFDCGSFNWHDNDVCISCGSPLFRNVNQDDINFLNGEIGEQGNYEVDT